MDDRPSIATLLTNLADYSNTIPAPTDPDSKAAPPQPGGARMGTLVGVFLPCIQNIFGVILFIRLTWVVGTAGAIQGFLIVLCCCSVVSRKFLFLNNFKILIRKKTKKKVSNYVLKNRFQIHFSKKNKIQIYERNINFELRKLKKIKMKKMFQIIKKQKVSNSLKNKKIQIYDRKINSSQRSLKSYKFMISPL